MHPKVFRAIECIARYHATQEAKEQIRHRGEKVSDHAPREINIIAHMLLVTRPQEFVDRGKASAVVKEVEAKIEAQARGALGRNSKDLSNAEIHSRRGCPLNETYAQKDAAMTGIRPRLNGRTNTGGAQHEALRAAGATHVFAESNQALRQIGLHWRDA